MDLNRMSRRDVLAWAAAHGVLLGGVAAGRGAAKEADAAKYPPEKALRALERDGWVIEYKKADALREGKGLRAPSILPPDKFACFPVILEAQFQAIGRVKVVLPSFAHVGDQTCLATRVEVEANGKLLRKGRDYTARPLVTKPTGNRFWQFALTLPRTPGPVRVRVTGLISSPEAPRDRKAARAKIEQLAARDNDFDKKHQVKPVAHWLKKPSDKLKEVAAEPDASGTKNRFEALMKILRYANKKGKLTEGTTRDPEEFVSSGFKGSCGANADFVNYLATAAGVPCLYYTEGWVVVPELGYAGLHAWNTACCNGLFIADSLNPALVFPEYSGYVATCVGPNLGHPNGENGSTNGGYVDGNAAKYYIYCSMLGQGKHADELKKLAIPEGAQLLADYVAARRKGVDER